MPVRVGLALQPPRRTTRLCARVVRLPFLQALLDRHDTVVLDQRVRPLLSVSLLLLHESVLHESVHESETRCGEQVLVSVQLSLRATLGSARMWPRVGTALLVESERLDGALEPLLRLCSDCDTSLSRRAI